MVNERSQKQAYRTIVEEAGLPKIMLKMVIKSVIVRSVNGT
jgi:hypothetical protein